MSDPLALLAELKRVAFSSAPVTEANGAIEQARVTYGSAEQPALSYEVLANDGASATRLAHQTLARLVYFVDCRGMALSAKHGLVVSLFTTDTVYFLDMAIFVQKCAEARALSLEELRRRYGANGLGDPLNLGT